MPNYRRQTSTWTISSFLAVLLATLFGVAGAAHAQCSNPANAIVAENCLPGNPQSEWDINNSDAGDPTIQGFATDISVNRGSTVYFKIKTNASAYTINIYRMGYYGGMGARKVATITPSVPLPQTQPACATDASVGLADCGNWAVSASWAVPATATSGIYFAHLIRTNTGGDSHIVFIVRNDSSHSAVLFQTNDSTWQAYNYYGGGSFYGPNSPSFDLSNRSYKVSYNRPVMTRGFDNESATWVFGSNYPMVRWLEANGYDVTYFTDVDAARNGSLILNHKLYMADGHDEYVSGPERANIKAARDAGVNLALFTGNGMFWKTRWENSIDGSNTAYRTLVCYKETLAFAKIDPTSTWTGTWRDPSFSPPADGGQPENVLQGTIFMVNGPGADNNGLSLKVPAADGKMRFWRNTAVASLAASQTYTMPAGTLGYEWDEDVDNGFRPAGLFDLSTATYSLNTDLLLDYGGAYGAGTATHHMTMYRAPSGALVFGSGTVQWSWGLDSNHDNSFGFATPNPDMNMQQATVNLFADMGVQPASLQPGLSTATASTDTTRPVSTITSPVANTTVHTGNGVTITGTATDTGGVVAGVEVSGDNGATWHPATGRASWSYTWTPSVVGSATILSRAVDDSGNLETPSSGVTVNVQPQTCPCSIWNASSSPTVPDSGDGNSVEVGVKFRADSDGSALGVRFYKASTNTGTHIGHLWSSTGTLLGTVTFTKESGSGWQQVNFSSPISVTANTTYVASYLAPGGHYSDDSEYFLQAGYNNPPLHALANGVDGTNGVYLYTTSGGFPNQSYLSTNYWVDVVYTSSNTYSLSGTISGTGGGGATVSLTGTESLSTTSSASGSYSIAGLINGTYTVSVSNPGVTFAPTSQTVTINGTPVSNVNFTATVTNPLSISGTITGGAGAKVNLGGAATATTTADSSGNYSFSGLMGGSYTVTPVLPGYIFTPYSQSVNLSATNATNVNFQGQVCTCVSIWKPSSAPSLIDSNDGTPVEVGVKFRADATGYIAGVRFYKAATNVGTHVAHLWSGTGALLATASFTNETASGWQQVNFSQPVAISANTTYIVSYFAPSGHYSADTRYFATTGVDSPPLHALAEGVDGSNGVYVYTSSGGVFPANSYQSTNYWVDVVYMGYQSYGISGTISGAGAGATVTLSGPATGVTTADSSGNYGFSGLFAGTYTVTPGKTGYIMVPGSQTVAISNASVTGVNFTVPSICPCNTVWQPSTVPTVIDQNDPQATALGLRFRADSDGYVVGVRFYKSAANTGTHIGNLWTNAQSGSGSLLATASFANESTTGWQQVTFANPVPAKANTTYVVSYFAPAGHYSATAGAFATSGVDSPPLHALANGVDGLNGIYSYSSTSTYPSSSFNSSNYWVDVIYAPATTYTLAGTITGVGASGTLVTLSGPVSATATTGASGAFAFNGLPNGTYTVTPSNGGIAFNPASQTVTINGGHQLTVNFTSSLPYSISGTIAGGGGDTVALSGSATATTTADASGNYTFPQVANGTYTVTPGTAGFAVSPASQNVTVNGAVVTGVNFTATVVTYAVSGTITGGAGATVSLTGPATATTTADASGNYSFGGLVDGTYTVRPSGANLIFNPGTLTLVVHGANITGANFAVLGNCPCNTIWQPSVIPGSSDVGDTNSVELGVKFRADADGYVSGIRFYKSFSNQGTHQGSLWTSTGTLLATATFASESSTGWQQVIFSQPVAVKANTTYVASYFAPKGHYAADSGFFTSQGVNAPPLHALQNGVDGPNGVYGYSATSAFPTSSANATNYWVDLIYSPTTTYTIAGTISGPGGAGAAVNLSGAATATTTADASGKFSFNGLANGNYTVVPSASGYQYNPAATAVTVNNAHVLGIAITSSQTNGISGTISGAGGAGATVTLSGAATATVTANASGVYSFTGLANGNYTVTPSKTGYVMTPSSQAVTVNGSSATANFTSLQIYTLSGTLSGAGGSGATVTLSGTSSATVTASSTGAYSFTVTNGSYTVTPTKTGFIFTPANRAVTINGANATANFTSAQTYSITGTITGVGGVGVTVSLTGKATAKTVTDSSGAFTFSGLVSGTYKVQPKKSGTTFMPSSQSVTINTSNVTGVNFLAL